MRFNMRVMEIGGPSPSAIFSKKNFWLPPLFGFNMRVVDFLRNKRVVEIGGPVPDLYSPKGTDFRLHTIMAFNMSVMDIGGTSPQALFSKKDFRLTPLMGFNMRVVEIGGTSPGTLFSK